MAAQSTCCSNVWNKKSAILCLFIVCLLILLLTCLDQLRNWQSPAFHLEDHLKCACNVSRRIPEVTSAVNSSCSDWSSLRGGGQRVVSFSVYGNAQSYFKGIAKNAALLSNLYPGWLMRVYYHWDQPEAEVRKRLCPLWCSFPHLDLCSVAHLPWPLGDQTNLHPMLWRMLPLGDPLVERFVSRDLDSLVTEREVSAVQEWVASGKTFHFMHDHPKHLDRVMGGMWGASNANLTLTQSIRDQLLVNGTGLRKKFQDQNVLSKVLYPVAERSGDYINHDSYNCQSKLSKNAQPWPQRRKGRDEFVGCQIMRSPCKLNKPCPKLCRPKQHQDWDNC